MADKNFTKNIILYGPPGTGKTYNTVICAVAIATIEDNKSLEDAVEEVKKNGYEKALKQYNKLKTEGRIAFTTFHQSYGYEEFIEGIRPKLTDDNTGDVSYELYHGVFKRFCRKALEPFKQLDIDNAIENFINDEKGKNTKTNFSFTKTTFTITINERNTIRVDSKTPDGDAGTISKEELIRCFNGKGTRLYAQAIRQYIEKNYLTNANATKSFIFIIDEINRGNISKIFGELITLIEDTKRLGAEEAYEAVLPYSNESFGIPNNVYIIGTMNTADRSIALMDTALRRRFSFVEMLPDSNVLRDIMVEGIDKETDEKYSIDISQMLEVMNKRIAALYDREHTIGHAYFTSLKKDNSIEKLADIFKNKVIPLLQEYFYDDYEKIRLVLGDNQKKDKEKHKNGRYCFIVKKELEPKLFGDENPDKCTDTYEINKDHFDNLEFYEHLKIYKKPSSNLEANENIN